MRAEDGLPEAEGQYVYILRCGDGTLYTGWTTHMRRRLEAHRSGRGARYTRGRGPLTLVYCESLPTKSEALRREAYIKTLSRAKKERLIMESAVSENDGQEGGK